MLSLNMTFKHFFLFYCATTFRTFSIENYTTTWATTIKQNIFKFFLFPPFKFWTSSKVFRWKVSRCYIGAHIKEIPSKTTAAMKTTITNTLEPTPLGSTYQFLAFIYLLELLLKGVTIDRSRWLRSSYRSTYFHNWSAGFLMHLRRI